MCTLTWLSHKDGYEVFFNRDEKRNRPKATLPVLDTATHAIYPVDPQGGGTWIALTRDGSTLCLLNNYQAQANSPGGSTPTSRGQLIKSLLKTRIVGLQDAIEQLSPARFSPFTCCYFSSANGRHNQHPEIVNWDGQTLSEDAADDGILISSGVDFHTVQQARRESLQSYPKTPAGLLKFHSSHHPEPSAYSVCMHRPDAQTHSLSHIQVRNGRGRFIYYDGAPCCSDPQHISG